jgi:hydroxyethylthiazole kinase-like uncharacterized protein yjeF
MSSYDAEGLAALLPFPQVNMHKYSRGKLLLVAGSQSYPGAACMAAYAGQRMGAGYVEAFTHADNVVKLQTYRPSLVVRSWEALLAKDSLEQSREGRPCAYLVGSGFDATDSESAHLLMHVLKNAEAPVLVDGGAIPGLSGTAARALCRSRHEKGLITVITPHSGEAAVIGRPLGLTGLPQVDYAEELAWEYGSIVVLKGANTVVSDGERSFAMTEGTAALAKAGTGDVLAGMIAALLAQGLGALDACVLGATLHARAGVAAAMQFTDICVTPEDVIDAIPAAVRRTVEMSLEAARMREAAEAASAEEA